MKRLLLLFLIVPCFAYSQHMGSTMLEVKELPQPPVRDVSIDQYLSRFPTTLNSTQREWFYWTNFSRSNPKRFWDSVIAPILEIHPNFRNSYVTSLKEDLYKASPLPLVKPNDFLFKTAQQLATKLAEKKVMPSHTDPSGVTFQERMETAGIKRCAGENISFGPPNTLMMLVLLYVDEGVPGLGHRKTLLNSSYVEMGVGIGAYPEGKYMIVTDFACDQK